MAGNAKNGKIKNIAPRNKNLNFRQFSIKILPLLLAIFLHYYYTTILHIFLVFFELSTTLSVVQGTLSVPQRLSAGRQALNKKYLDSSATPQNDITKKTRRWNIGGRELKEREEQEWGVWFLPHPSPLLKKEREIGLHGADATDSRVISIVTKINRSSVKINHPSIVVVGG